MAINSVQDFTGRADPARWSAPAQQPVTGTTETGKPGFDDLVKDFARDVNDLQFQAGHAIDLLATGRAADVHQVMIAVEEASIALDLMLEVRNRVLEGYQELIRMQV
jgi:flagellar hook-basal body complex protein FliE